MSGGREGGEEEREEGTGGEGREEQAGLLRRREGGRVGSLGVVKRLRLPRGRTHGLLKNLL